MKTVICNDLCEMKQRIESTKWQKANQCLSIYPSFLCQPPESPTFQSTWWYTGQEQSSSAGHAQNSPNADSPGWKIPTPPPTFSLARRQLASLCHRESHAVTHTHSWRLISIIGILLPSARGGGTGGGLKSAYVPITSTPTHPPTHTHSHTHTHTHTHTMHTHKHAFFLRIWPSSIFRAKFFYGETFWLVIELPELCFGIDCFFQ